MQKVILNITTKTHEALQQRRAETGCPSSLYIRRVLDAALTAGKRLSPESELAAPVMPASTEK